MSLVRAAVGRTTGPVMLSTALRLQHLLALKPEKDPTQAN